MLNKTKLQCDKKCMGSQWSMGSFTHLTLQDFAEAVKEDVG